MSWSLSLLPQLHSSYRVGLRDVTTNACRNVTHVSHILKDLWVDVVCKLAHCFSGMLCTNNQENSRMAECWDEMQRHHLSSPFDSTHFVHTSAANTWHLVGLLTSGLSTFPLLSRSATCLGGSGLSDMSENLFLASSQKSFQDRESLWPSPFILIYSHVLDLTVL